MLVDRIVIHIFSISSTSSYILVCKICEAIRYICKMINFRANFELIFNVMKSTSFIRLGYFLAELSGTGNLPYVYCYHPNRNAGLLYILRWLGLKLILPSHVIVTCKYLKH